MAVEILLARTLRGLEPVDDDAREQLKIWPLGKVVKGKYVVPRSLGRLKWYWKLCGLVADNTDIWPTKENVSDSLKMELGIFETYVVSTPQGTWKEERKPGSIAFGNMDEDEFRKFCVDAQNVICAKFLYCAYDDLVSVLEDYLNPDSRRKGREAA